MVRLSSAFLALLVAAQAVSGQGVFSYDNPAYFPNSCKKAGQLALMFTDGPSKYTTDILTNLAGVQDAKTLSFFPVTTFLKDVTSNVPLRSAATAGAFIGMRWTTLKKLSSLSATEIATQLEADCNLIATYTSKYPKYIFLPRDQVDQASYNAVVSAGYTPISYNLDSSDYLYANATSMTACTASIVNTYRSFLGQLPNGSAYWIALERDLTACTAASAVQVVQTIKSYGYTIVDMGTCLGDANPYRTSCSSGSAASTASAPPSSPPSSPASSPATSTTAAAKSGSAKTTSWTVSGAVAALSAVAVAVVWL